jgi:hypothetical protein
MELLKLIMLKNDNYLFNIYLIIIIQFILE